MKTIVLIFCVFAILATWVLNRIFALRQNSLKGTTVGEMDGIYMFTTPTCKICSALKNAYSQESMDGNITIIDITRNEESAELARKYGIRSVPTTAVIRQGKIIELFHGFVPRADLDKWLNS